MQIQHAKKPQKMGLALAKRMCLPQGFSLCSTGREVQEQAAGADDQESYAYSEEQIFHCRSFFKSPWWLGLVGQASYQVIFRYCMDDKITLHIMRYDLMRFFMLFYSHLFATLVHMCCILHIFRLCCFGVDSVPSVLFSLHGENYIHIFVL